MKFTQVRSDTFQRLQLNAGLLMTAFDVEDATVSEGSIIGATSGGVEFSAEPEFVDFGEDVDNVPKNTKELKRIESWTATMSGTLVTADTETARLLLGAADVDGSAVAPRSYLVDDDFADVWWVGDYSDVNTDSDDGQEAGFLAIRLIDALSTGGFKVQSGDNEKGQFEFEFTAHYTMDDPDAVPFEVYVSAGTEAE